MNTQEAMSRIVPQRAIETGVIAMTRRIHTWATFALFFAHSSIVLAQEVSGETSAHRVVGANLDLPAIEFWYGDVQRFGNQGNPQPAIHILGNIDNSEQVAEAYFQLNSGKRRQFSLGPDLHRLARRGDFNLEIERSSLKMGNNTLRVALRTPLGRDVKKDITIQYDGSTECRLPIEIDFSKVDNLQDVTEVVDGKWTLTDDGVRTAEPYYDRTLVFGDAELTDFEVTASIIFHRHLPKLNGRNPQGSPYLSHAHTSFNMRWTGFPDDGHQPRRDWQNLGALVALRSDLAMPNKGCYWWMHFGRGIRGVPARRSVMSKDQRYQIAEGELSNYRMRVVTESKNASKYSAKVWKVGQPEPDQWQMEAVDTSEAFPSGCVMFVVHHSDVTICRLQIAELKSSTDNQIGPTE